MGGGRHSMAMAKAAAKVTVVKVDGRKDGVETMALLTTKLYGGCMAAAKVTVVKVALLTTKLYGGFMAAAKVTVVKVEEGKELASMMVEAVAALMAAEEVALRVARNRLPSGSRC